jgi:MATE family multidrug resistance protein
MSTSFTTPSPALLTKLELTRQLLMIAVPSAMSFFLNFALQLISVISVGHLGDLELGAAGIGNMIANVTGKLLPHTAEFIIFLT